jgi:hypothetical protein
LTPAKYQAKFIPILPGDGLTAPQAMAVEAILTFNSCMIALSVTAGCRRKHPMPGLPVGLCVGAGILAAVSSSFNYLLFIIFINYYNSVQGSFQLVSERYTTTQ